MIIDASTLFDLLRLVVNRSDEKIKKLMDALFEIYNDNISSISSSDMKYCELYITLCKEIVSHQINISDHKIDIANLFKRHLTNQVFKKDKYIHDSLKSIIESEIGTSRIADITKRLNNIISWHVSSKFITKLYGQLKESSLSYSVDDQEKALFNVKSLIDEFRTTINDVDTVSSKFGPVEVIDLSNMESIRNAHNLFKERRVNHILRTGLQGLNKMFGPSGGMALGESILFAARTHHFKSGILTKMLQWIPMYSRLPDTLTKKPMILLISLENEGYQNMMKLFKEMYVALKGNLPPAGINDDQIVNDIYEFFNNSGYTLVIERYLPENFGSDELISLVEKYENSGFKIIACIIDYLTQMRTHTSGSASTAGKHDLLQNICNRVVNFCKAAGITMITAHQLNRGASDIAASGIPHPVKHYSERHFAGSTGIAREFDFIAYQEIEKDEAGNPWLTMNWGKHRYVDDTPEIDKFAAFPFTEKGILDDIDKPATHVRDIYRKNSNNKQASQADIESILGISPATTQSFI